jgi:hypothetical protein
MRSSTYAISMAPHAWPALASAQCVMAATVRGRSQSPRTIAGSLPPISMLEGMPRSAQWMRTLRPEAGEPVKTHASTPASTSIAPTAPSPCTTDTRPSGSSAASRSRSQALVRGVNSDGLRTTPLPVMRAGKTER